MFSFPHLACLDQKWKAKAVDELQSNTKKKTSNYQKINVKNVRFKILSLDTQANFEYEALRDLEDGISLF